MVYHPVHSVATVEIYLLITTTTTNKPPVSPHLTSLHLTSPTDLGPGTEYIQYTPTQSKSTEAHLQRRKTLRKGRQLLAGRGTPTYRRCYVSQSKPKPTEVPQGQSTSLPPKKENQKRSLAPQSGLARDMHFYFGGKELNIDQSYLPYHEHTTENKKKMEKILRGGKIYPVYIPKTPSASLR